MGSAKNKFQILFRFSKLQLGDLGSYCYKYHDDDGDDDGDEDGDNVGFVLG